MPNASIFDLVGQARPEREAKKKRAKKKVEEKWGTVEEWYRRLCMVCLVLRYGYYCKSRSLFSEDEYNALEKLILRIEDKNRELMHPNSPTSIVGSELGKSYPRSVRMIWKMNEEDGTLELLTGGLKRIVRDTQEKFGV